jgi:hypothetical protein
MSQRLNIDSSIMVSTLKRFKVESEIIKPFNDFSSAVRTSIFSQSRLEIDEKEAILSFTNGSQWLLLTSIRIIQKSHDKTESIYYSDIHRVEINTDDSLIGDSSFKKQLHILSLHMKSGEKILIDIGDFGSILFPFESALSWAVKKSS